MHRFGTVVATLALVIAACDRDPTTLRVVMPLLPVEREISGDLADLLANSPSIRLGLTASPITEADAMEALVTGRADLALLSNSVPYRPGIAAVMPLYPTVLHVAYSGDGEASAGADLLRGAKVFAGSEGSASRLLFEAVVDHIGLGEDEFEYADTDPDVIVIFTPISRELVAGRPGFRLFSFGEPGDVGSGSTIDAAVMLNPHLRPFVIPARIYGEITPGPVLTLGVDQYVVAR
jgi:DNA-binding transcriptional LysR family regulator